MKLYIDDERPCPEGWTPAKTYEEAVALLGTRTASKVSFDHDLGTIKTGYDVAVWLENEVYHDPSFPLPEMYVHSANPVGRKHLELAITSIRYIKLNGTSDGKES